LHFDGLDWRERHLTSAAQRELLYNHRLQAPPVLVVPVPDNQSSDKKLHGPVNAYVDAVFVLSVRSFHDRIAHIERELNRHRIAFEWIFEHDAKDLTQELIDSRFAPSDMGRPQQSLVLKHIETWKRCVERGYRRILVFEDDAILASDFAQRFEVALREADLIRQPHMLYLGCGDNKYVPREQGTNSALVRTDLPLPATDATVVDQRAARLRLEYVDRHRITRPADWLMREADAAMGITHYWLSDPIVEQGSMNGTFSSVLDRKRIGRGRAWSWMRFRWDRWRRRMVSRNQHEPPIDEVHVAPAQMRREEGALFVARAATALVAIGTFTGPALANAAAAIMLLAFLATPSCLQRVLRAWRQPLGKASLVFSAVLLVATLWSTAPLGSALRAWVEWRNFLVLFIALAIFDTRASKLAFAATFVTVASAAAIASFFTFDFGAAQTFSDVKGGIVLRNHVTQGMALTVGALFALVLAVQAQRGSWQQWACGAAATLMVANVVFIAYGRSGYVLLFITAFAVALGFWRGRARGVALAVVFALAVGAAQFSPLIKKRFTQAVEEVTQTDTAAELTPMGIRVMMWETAAAIVREAPFIGHGLGSFAEEYRREVKQRYTGWRATLTADPHNQYLFILAETGLLGMGAFVWFLVSAVRQPTRGPFQIIALAALLSWCVTSLFSSHFHTFNEGHLIAILLGVCLACEVAAQHQERSALSTAALTSS
jgi:O-antigen ligase/GR25 family glycosyltransferase involved in LPS biosynthesis